MVAGVVRVPVVISVTRNSFICSFIGTLSCNIRGVNSNLNLMEYDIGSESAKVAGLARLERDSPHQRGDGSRYALLVPFEYLKK
ncbi:hypothetical protein L6452_36076 [Arctium lappa]|uniref:Uncharacterized protein n=1 Tax=Arctium lappa TaxID=4217 RepID=A0ACB8Y928_ARCLA|nr:hypothetical protein L6452_36076 [Arctium lappa]